MQAKRVLSLVLALILVAGMLPVGAIPVLATEETEVAV